VRLKTIKLKPEIPTIEIDIAFIEIDILSEGAKRNPMVMPTRAATNMGDDNAKF
jgi:hypothetical protein